MSKATITQAILREMFRYDPETGDFIRLKQAGRELAGSIAGSFDRRGRRSIHINHRVYLAHRLIWLYVHGRWPLAEIDHIDRNPSNNRLDNLREATRRQNAINRVGPKAKSGFTGVVLRSDKKAWFAQCRDTDGKPVYLGSFKTREEAAECYRRFRLSVHGEFACIQ
jgi:hypothetical protein